MTLYVTVPVEVMEQDRQTLLTAVALIAQELIDSSSSSESDNEELEILQRNVNQRRKVPRIQNYMETIVPMLTNQQFKAHFRYQLAM